VAEIGPVKFATVALEVTSRVLPRYRTTRSKHIFTQPQLLATLLLMRFEDWTFRETEVRLLEHAELRNALALKRVPDYTTLYRFMRRLDPEVLDKVLSDTISSIPAAAPARDAGMQIAVDGTGLASVSICTYFVKRTGGRPRRHYLKWVIAADMDNFTIVAQVAHRGPTNDTASLPELIEKSCRLRPVGLVLADAEFDSRQNHDYIRNVAGAMSVIPATRSKVMGRATGVRAEMQNNFPAKLYSRRGLVETVFSMVKRKLSARAPGRSLKPQILQTFLLGVAFNIYRLKRWLFRKPIALYIAHR